MDEQRALAHRLDALEKQNRRLRYAVAAAVVVATAAGAAAQVAQTAVTGDRFVLVDGQNRTRATLDMALTPSAQGAPRQPVLTFLDGAGKPRLRLGLGSRGPLLELIDENGKTKDYFAPAGPRPLTPP